MRFGVTGLACAELASAATATFSLGRRPVALTGKAAGIARGRTLIAGFAGGHNALDRHRASPPVLGSAALDTGTRAVAGALLPILPQH